jgi:hypothetical protein
VELLFFDRIKRQRLHIVNSERWCDPRAKLLKGEAWDQHKIPVCRSLNLLTDFDEAFDYLSTTLDDACVVA